VLLTGGLPFLCLGKEIKRGFVRENDDTPLVKRKPFSRYLGGGRGIKNWELRPDWRVMHVLYNYCRGRRKKKKKSEINPNPNSFP